MKNIIIIYHAECPDGFGGAWSAWKKFGSRATYIAAKHHLPPIDTFKNKEIYFIDFVYPINAVKKLIKNNKRVVLIDHHISAKTIADIVEEKLFKMNNSGAVLAWQYFHPGKKEPKLLQHIQDVDLWKFKISHTDEVITYLNLFEFDFRTWNRLASEVENARKFREIINHTKWILRYEKRRIDRLINNAEMVKFCGYKTLAVNSPIWESELGAALSKKLPPMGIVWRQKSDGYKTFSLRSNGGVDVAKLAAKFGGGGHKRASGFSVKPGAKLPWQRLSNKKRQ
ncbi:MAG: DHHA1 domain-containing protein [bacterium]|nr:DHHA1 domain-containing protein [bacterium]